MEHTDPNQMKKELPAYMTACEDVQDIDDSDVAEFSEKVLAFWRKASKRELREWRKAAKIVFALSPNSASCERVFSLLANMYGERQHAVLADHVQASIMLRFNGRSAND